MNEDNYIFNHDEISKQIKTIKTMSYPSQTDNGYKLEMSQEKPYIEIHTGHYLDGRKEHLFVDNKNPIEEVIRINALFFQKPYKNQKASLRLLIWWSIKHYFKILFK
jgi:hypothetical protein